MALLSQLSEGLRILGPLTDPIETNVTEVGGHLHVWGWSKPIVITDEEAIAKLKALGWYPDPHGDGWLHALSQ